MSDQDQIAPRPPGVVALERLRSEVDQIVSDRPAGGLAQLRTIFLDSEDEYGFEGIPALAATAMLAYEDVGVDAIVALFDEARRVRGRTAVFQAVYEGATNRVGQSPPALIRGPSLTFDVEGGTKAAARAAYRELVIRCQSDPGLLFYLMQFLYMSSGIGALSGAGGLELMSVVEILRDSTIRLTRQMIEEFRTLINDASTPEGELQSFLGEHPVFVNPLALVVYPKHALGAEFETDYVVRTLDDQYIVVEIEKASDRIFTASADFRKEVTHAVGQVLDFQDWVEHNVAYAREKLPNIVSPTGLVVIGRDAELDERRTRKLRRYNINFGGRIRVVTFDGLLADAERLYRNLIEGPSG